MGDVGAVVGDGLLILVALFVVRLVVLSVWDAWSLKKSMAAAAAHMPEPEAVREIDTGWKERLREEQHREWEQDFIVGLGEDADGLVREWGKGSKRLELARLLKEDAEEARRRKDWRVAESVRKMREVLTANPELPFSAGEIELMKSERERWYRTWSGPEREYVVQSADGTRVTYRTDGRRMYAEPPVPPRGPSGVSVPRRYPVDGGAQ